MTTKELFQNGVLPKKSKTIPQIGIFGLVRAKTAVNCLQGGLYHGPLLTGRYKYWVLPAGSKWSICPGGIIII